MLVLDAEVGEPALEGVEAAAVRRRAFAVGLQDLLQPRHAARELADGLEARACASPAAACAKAAASPKRAQHLDQPRAQAVRRLHQLGLEQAVA